MGLRWWQADIAGLCRCDVADMRVFAPLPEMTQAGQQHCDA